MTPDDPTVVVLHDEAVATVAAYRNAKAHQAAASEEVDAQRCRLEDILTCLGGNEPECVVGVDGHGNEIVRLTVVWSSRLDTKKLRESHPSVADSFTRTATSVRITVPQT